MKKTGDVTSDILGSLKSCQVKLADKDSPVLGQLLMLLIVVYICDSFFVIQSVACSTTWYGSTSLQQSSERSCSFHHSGHNLQSYCKRQYEKVLAPYFGKLGLHCFCGITMSLK